MNDLQFFPETASTETSNTVSNGTTTTNSTNNITTSESSSDSNNTNPSPSNTDPDPANNDPNPNNTASSPDNSTETEEEAETPHDPTKDAEIFLTIEQVRAIKERLVPQRRKKRKVEKFDAYVQQWSMPIKYKFDTNGGHSKMISHNLSYLVSLSYFLFIVLPFLNSPQ